VARSTWRQGFFPLNLYLQFYKYENFLFDVSGVIPYTYMNLVIIYALWHFTITYTVKNVTKLITENEVFLITKPTTLH